MGVVDPRDCDEFLFVGRAGEDAVNDKHNNLKSGVVDVRCVGDRFPRPGINRLADQLKRMVHSAASGVSCDSIEECRSYLSIARELGYIDKVTSGGAA